MAERKARGSIILEVLIVIMLVVLAASLYIPKAIWNAQDVEIETSRRWMGHLWTAETAFKSKTKNYAQTVDEIIALALDDTSYKSMLDQFYTSSITDEDDSTGMLFPMPLDSLRVCPISGEPFTIATTDSTPALSISCPVEEGGFKPFYLFGKYEMPDFFRMEMKNSGQIVDGKLSWE